MDTSSSPPEAETRRRKAALAMFLVAFVAILVSFLFWVNTWYGIELTDDELREYLQETDNVRHVLHALERLSMRVHKDRATAEPFYPLVLPLAEHKEAAVRRTAAWFMGEDHKDEQFRHALLKMLADPDLLVRYNTACALAAFRDDSGREVLRAMLVPHVVCAETEGTVTAIFKAKEFVGLGKGVVWIDTGAEKPVKEGAPLPGKVLSVSKKIGDRVRPGDEICTIAPTAREALNALTALYFVGRLDDLSTVQRYLSTVPYFDSSKEVEDRAALTAKRIQERAKEESEAAKKGR